MRIAILVSTPVAAELVQQVKEGLHPRPDFLALADALDAKLITMRPGFDRSGPKPLRLFRVAWMAFKQRHHYDLVISDVDRVGLLLALLFKLFRASNRLVVICHGKIVSRQDLRAIQALGLDAKVHRYVCYGPAVAQRLRKALHLPYDKVVVVRHGPDHRFWHPRPVTPERLIVSAGMLRRDYPTLIEAVRGLDVSLTIAAFSPWVTSQSHAIGAGDLPANVQLVRCSSLELRELYARALFVAVPLQRSRAQSGSLVAYEAMAMGKPVVMTRTDGQDALAVLEEGKTGYYVAPGDVNGWRETILRLTQDTERAIQMGKQARRVVEQGLNMDAYVRSITEVVRSVAAQGQEAMVARDPARG